MTIHQFNKIPNSIFVAGVVLVAIAGNHSSVVGQSVVLEDLILTASDATGGDQFGYSVAVSDAANGGQYGIVGAPYDDDFGLDSGAAYVFDLSTGQQIRKLTPANFSPGGHFGWSVAIEGTIAIVGSPDDDDFGSVFGTADLFDVVSGKNLGHLVPNEPVAGTRFGISVAIRGNLALVGRRSTAAYLFDVSTGQQLNQFTPDDPFTSGFFGDSVDLTATFAVVGAPGADFGGVFFIGAAYVFSLSTGQQLHKLGEAIPTGHEFGWSVSMDNSLGEELILIGAWGTDDLCPSDPTCNSGSAYLFSAATGQQHFKMVASDATPGAEFGRSVALQGLTAVIGAGNDGHSGPGTMDGPGAAYLFDVFTGQEISKVSYSQAAMGDAFGNAVAIGGIPGNEIVMTGIALDDGACPPDPNCDSGSVAVFDLSSAAPCLADFTPAGGNGVVNIDDLVFLLNAFGSCPIPPKSCAADIMPPGGNGMVNIDDLVAVLNGFGACP